MMANNIRKIDVSQIDLSKIYKNSSDAANKTNNVNGNINIWNSGDLELSYNEETGVGLVTKNGTGIGFVNIADIKKVDDNSIVDDSVIPPQTSKSVVFDSEKYYRQKAENLEKRITNNVSAQENNVDNSHIISPLERIAMEEKIAMKKANNTSSTTAAQIQQINVDENNDSIQKSGIFDYSYDKAVRGKNNISQEAAKQLGVVTNGNQSYKVVADNDYHQDPGTISESQKKLLVAVVAGESANNGSDMLGVTSTVLNRLESNLNMGNTVNEVLEKGYFPWGRSYLNYEKGGKYYDTAWGQEKLALAEKIVDTALSGSRNISKSTYYYSGDGKHNYFSDVV